MTWQKTPQRSLCFFLWGGGLGLAFVSPRPTFGAGWGAWNPSSLLRRHWGRQDRHFWETRSLSEPGTDQPGQASSQALGKLELVKRRVHRLFTQKRGHEPTFPSRLTTQTWTTPVLEPPPQPRDR